MQKKEFRITVWLRKRHRLIKKSLQFLQGLG